MSSPRRTLQPSVALLLVLALTASACGAFGADGSYPVRAELERSYNLFVGSPVRVLGVDVGTVTELTTSPGSGVVTVEMSIDGDVGVPVDAAAIVVPESLLGERYVQLEPAYTGGERMEPDSTIPVERTAVPAEFDEVLEGLNQFVGGLDGGEVGRLFDNLATVLDGQGEQVGRVIDQARDAIGVLRENDEELVSLAGRLADLNETLGTRDQALGAIIEDWNTVAGTLASDRTQLDRALRGLVRLTDELGSLLQSNRTNLQEDIDTLTRVGRTANRNLDNISMLVLGGAELFRHAERVIDREHNWLRLQNHSGAFGNEIARTVANRLAGLCLRAGLDEEQCRRIPIEELVGGELCLEPLAPCPDDGSVKSLPQAVRDVLEASPELTEALRDERDDSDEAPAEDAALDEALARLLRDRPDEQEGDR